MYIYKLIFHGYSIPKREYNFKANGLPRRAFHRDFPAMGLCDGQSHGQADSRAAGVDGPGFIHAVEAVKKPVKVRGICQIAGVEHLNAGFSVPAIDIQLYLAAFVRILYRVVKKNGYNLLDGASVSMEIYRLLNGLRILFPICFGKNGKWFCRLPCGVA